MYKPYVTDEERQQILQWVNDERKNALNPSRAKVKDICASVAMNRLCNGDVKIWNSRKGELAYMRVLTTVLSFSGSAVAIWKE